MIIGGTLWYRDRNALDAVAAGAAAPVQVQVAVAATRPGGRTATPPSRTTVPAKYGYVNS